MTISDLEYQFDRLALLIAATGYAFTSPGQPIIMFNKFISEGETPCKAFALTKNVIDHQQMFNYPGKVTVTHEEWKENQVNIDKMNKVKSNE